MNESDSEESVENWLVNFSSKNLKNKKQSTIINFAGKITTKNKRSMIHFSERSSKTIFVQKNNFFFDLTSLAATSVGFKKKQSFMVLVRVEDYYSPLGAPLRTNF